MVTTVTSFGRSGLYDWLMQRVSGVILLAWFLTVGGFLVANPDLSYEQWRGLFDHTAMKVFSLAAVLSLAAHAWIGLWCVVTDYLTERLMGPRGHVLRALAQLVIGSMLFIYVVWGVQILWGS
jgi:succinate dehydrogenase / fumarate reductase membrane anchor subunit